MSLIMILRKRLKNKKEFKSIQKYLTILIRYIESKTFKSFYIRSNPLLKNVKFKILKGFKKEFGIINQH